MPHPLGEDYEFWCELNACRACGGDGMVEVEGTERACRACDGFGIDPSAEYVSPDGGSTVIGQNPVSTEGNP